MEAVKVRVALRFNLTPEQVRRAPFWDVMWMFKAVAYEQEKMTQQGDGDG